MEKQIMEAGAKMMEAQGRGRGTEEACVLSCDVACAGMRQVCKVQMYLGIVFVMYHACHQ